ncbi:efflux RND transporter periplasmic adaptor subunit [Lederbergia wuyishanensis]|uniref:RND family efflux transporter MFP subunit n=1 Tax=Lederbergia wuyishanensis TaxID=1347903 RepID=A0ABU0D8Y1_9BACI|nr:efflux RND transporter periplasmic adaptor subunit [Lederbergia wuyishanensis]MCJ8007546.1 efflux RND transporter periplasmic adaptor subunit [Lederbergia wuyishanensis]MDQ0344874.1 RND family efflux transporter MFP subunit [Lederbergia wuyishanensis]
MQKINKKSSSNRIKVYFLLGVFALLSIFLGGCSFLPKEEPVLAPPLVEPAKLDYETAEVKKGEIIKRVKGSGTMVPTSHHDLYYTKDGGRLKKISVREGDLVKKGQTLAELETGNLAFEIDQAYIDLKKAQLRLQQMEAHQDDKYSIEMGKLDIQSINNRLYFMNNQLAESKIVSPIDGVITYVTEIRQGQGVPAYESLFQVAETTQLQIQYTAINANDLADVKLGMDVITNIKGEDIKGKVVQTPKDVPADIYEKNPDLYSKSILVEAEKLPEEIKVGDIAGIEIITAKKKDTLIIPKNGLRTTVGRNYVQVMVDNTKREVDIEVGIISSTEVEVLKGLNEGDVIILK